MRLNFKVLFSACFAMTPAIATTQNLVTLDSTITYQTMQGWEVTPFVAPQCAPAFYPSIFQPYNRFHFSKSVENGGSR
jgi:hypothetical protein